MPRLTINEVRSKSVLHEMEGYREYTANFYRGCSHGCVYCYAPSLIQDDRRWGSFVDVKVNAPEVLSRELRKVRKGVVFLSSASDPYQPAEARYRVTRRALEVLARNDFPVVILTRSPLVLRDMDVLRRLSWVRVGFSISTVKDRLFEPGVAPVQRRIETMRLLGATGIKTWVSLAPVIPGKMEIDVAGLLTELKGAGVGSVSAGLLRFQGYGRSKELFEEVSGRRVPEFMGEAEEVIAGMRGMIEASGFEDRESFFDWKPAGGIESFIQAAATP